MKTIQANLINGLSLISFSLWGYFSSESPSLTAFIPTAIGIFLLSCHNGIKNENKIIAHVAVVLTLLAIIGLIKPLTGAIERVDNMAIMRIALMIFTSILVMITFIRSFIIARRK